MDDSKSKKSRLRWGKGDSHFLLFAIISLVGCYDKYASVWHESMAILQQADRACFTFFTLSIARSRRACNRTHNFVSICGNWFGRLTRGLSEIPSSILGCRQTLQPKPVSSTWHVRGQVSRCPPVSILSSKPDSEPPAEWDSEEHG